MLTLVRSGNYRLVETKGNQRVIYLDVLPFLWTEGSITDRLQLGRAGEFRTAFMVASGLYYLYYVKDEPRYSDTWHLEIQQSHDTWAGYLLHDNLPETVGDTKPITPCREVITPALSLFGTNVIRR